MQKPNKPLTPSQKNNLLHTREEDWAVEFPDHSNKFLRAEKRKLKAEMAELSPAQQVQVQQREISLAREVTQYRDQYKVATAEIRALRKQLEIAQATSGRVRAQKINLIGERGTHEATAIVQASDWHAESVIDSASVNDVNEYNPEIFDRRASMFFENTLKLLNKEANDIRIPRMILHLGGDFITNTIHPDLAESVALGPVEAVLMVQDKLASGISFWLKNTPKDFEIHCVCSCGNHDRITKDRRIQTAVENSLAFLIYANLARFFDGEDRVKFILPAGYFTYANVYGRELRFHHGDNIRYSGGVGGITIPVNKAIAQWNRTRVVYCDYFGHYHQRFDGGNFVSNGSLIGLDAYALSIKAAFEPPSQVFSLIDSEYGKTIVAPIWVE